MAHGLPTSVVLKSQSSNKYLRYVNHIEIDKFLQFSGEKPLSPDSIFELEISKSAEAAEMGLVHIRSSYNKKYWRKESKNTDWIIACADEPEEDKSKWSCTLFQPSFVEESKTTIRLRHVQLNSYVSVWRDTEKYPLYESCLYVGTSFRGTEGDDACIFEVINREIPPQYVAFKGKNGCYLNARSIGNSNILEFASSDLKDPYVAHRVIPTGDGTTVRLKSVYFDKFWRCNSGDEYSYISADTDCTTDGDANTLFSLVNSDHNHVALQNMGNNRFAKRFSHTGTGRLHYLAAEGSTITDEETNLEFIELKVQFLPIESFLQAPIPTN